MLWRWIKKIIGTAQGRQLNRYRSVVEQINQWDASWRDFSDEQIRNQTALFRERLKKGETLDQLLPEAYATVKNVCRRLCGVQVHVSGYDQKWDMVPYDEQLLGAIAMHNGTIVEMQTGEGKTLTAALPLYLNALASRGVHLVTVNDYLAKRDCEWMSPIFDFLGITTGYLTNDTPLSKRKAVYQQDVLYGTASEFGFDYLRDHSYTFSIDEKMQRGFHFAIIDEIDSILIDEARTPLIISGPSQKSNAVYEQLSCRVAQLVALQKQWCQKVVEEAQKEWQACQKGDEKALSRRERQQLQERKKAVLQRLWLIGKGMPNHVILRRLLEECDVRDGINQWDIYYYADQNKEEKWKALSELYIIIDERNSEYELTEKGIDIWSKKCSEQDRIDFTLFDLGEEYGKIDQMALSEEEKREKKEQITQSHQRQKEVMHGLRQLLRAFLLMERDVDYIVQEERVVIIDEHTGRAQPGRRFSDGLHQAIEAKERLTVQEETQTHATVTLQNYFRMYEKLSGMTGTAITEEKEFKEIYNLLVLQIPTHVPCQRKDAHDEIYITQREKYGALIREVQRISEKGRPILLGTESVEVSEKLAELLQQNRLPHTVLNAKQHEKEAEIIAQAGQKGAITIATNMAGRGTDIKLGKGIAELGGLHVIGCSRHHSRRIDRQLRGRCARLGDPGSSKFYISFEDSLMRLFSSPRIHALIRRYRPPEGESLASGLVDRSVEMAQKRVEQRHFTARKYTLEFDNVMNKQRSTVYQFRDEVLESTTIRSLAASLLEETVLLLHDQAMEKKDEEWEQKKDVADSLATLFPSLFPSKELCDESAGLLEMCERAGRKLVEAFYLRVEEEEKRVMQLTGKELEVAYLDEGIRRLLLHKVDQLWKDHLLEMDFLRSEINMRSVGQKDPLTEFKQEAFAQFASLSLQLKTEIATELFQKPFALPLLSIAAAVGESDSSPSSSLTFLHSPFHSLLDQSSGMEEQAVSANEKREKTKTGQAKKYRKKRKKACGKAS